MMEKQYEEEFPKKPMGNYSKKQVGGNKVKFSSILKKKKVSLEEFQQSSSKVQPSPKVHSEHATKDADAGEEWGKTLPLHLFTPVSNNVELHPCNDEEKTGWRRVKSVMDSGASESVQHPDEVPEVEVRPSPGSRIGQRYTSASGDEIPNLGEKILDVVTKEGIEFKTKYQAADVSRTLNSVSEVCDAGGPEGQYVIYSKWGGQIWNPQTRRTMPFEREGGIYTLDTWVRVPSPSASGF